MTNQQTSLPVPKTKRIKDLPFVQLAIPPYQRPYKWTVKNVNDLINDITTFRNQSQYRLGTLVLHEKDGLLNIVDGQQRIITLTLIITFMYNNLPPEKKKYYQGFFQSIENFTRKMSFSNRYSLHNVVENIRIIKERAADLDDDLFDFIVKRCEFVVITLGDISEAFQFFDSQNGRGKALEPHDLLKAYHLREMSEMTASDSANIDSWQNQDTEFLKEIFKTLYRAKRWSQGKSAQDFTINDTQAFKGISVLDKKRYPFYQLEVIAHVFTQMYANDPTRLIDQHPLEYPFNLDDQIINGSRFFDMIRHYINLYHTVESIAVHCTGMAKDIIDCINNYSGIYRRGDTHVRTLFDVTLLYYLDRFGMEEIDKVIPKIFVWAYRVRLENVAVQFNTVDNHATSANSLIRLMHDAQSPYDIINLSIDINAGVKQLCSKCEPIKDLFNQLNKRYINGDSTKSPNPQGTAI